VAAEALQEPRKEATVIVEAELLGRAARPLDQLLVGVTAGRWQGGRTLAHERGGTVVETEMVSAGRTAR
jgi:hypothetical protein